MTDRAGPLSRRAESAVDHSIGRRLLAGDDPFFSPEFYSRVAGLELASVQDVSRARRGSTGWSRAPTPGTRPRREKRFGA